MIFGKRYEFVGNGCDLFFCFRCSVHVKSRLLIEHGFGVGDPVGDFEFEHREAVGAG